MNTTQTPERAALPAWAISAAEQLHAENRLHPDIRRSFAISETAQVIEREVSAYILNSRDRLLAVTHGVLVALKYPRGSEAQVRCLEEVGQDANAIVKELTKGKNP